MSKMRGITRRRYEKIFNQYLDLVRNGMDSDDAVCHLCNEWCYEKITIIKILSRWWDEESGGEILVRVTPGHNTNDPVAEIAAALPGWEVVKI